MCQLISYLQTVCTIKSYYRKVPEFIRKGIIVMNTPVKSITIEDLDKKLNSKAGFSNRKRKEYTHVMIQALLTDGMTEQNQQRFCNGFVATGIEPIIKLLNSEKGENWKSIVFPVINKKYFNDVPKMKLRFLMEFLSQALLSQLRNSQEVLAYCIPNIKRMEFGSKKKFRVDNITLFKECILNRWKADKAIKNIESKKAVEQLKEFVLLCLKEDKGSIIKNHPHFKEFGNWLAIVFDDSQKQVVSKNIHSQSDTKSMSAQTEKTDNNKNESASVDEATSHKDVVLTLQMVIDAFERKIIRRDTDIENLKKQIRNLNEQISAERQSALSKKAELESKLEKEKLVYNSSIKERDSQIEVLRKSLNQKDSLIKEQEIKLDERAELLQDNDVRFANQYKQKMTALGNKLKLPVSDLRDAINDLQGEDRDFIEAPFEDIINYLKKEGVTL